MVISLAIFTAALFIDGATDCANAVTGAVSSGAMSLKRATYMSAALSFFGCLVFCIFFPFVAEGAGEAISFAEGYAPFALCVSLLSVALWSGAAWVLGLPTSEGHALICASAGAALAFGGAVSVHRISLMLLSVFPSALLSALLSVAFARILRKGEQRRLRLPVIISAAVSSFFHGAQDGQKFLALAISASLVTPKNRISFSLCAAAFMALGTLFGERIIKKMGTEMAVCDTRSALASDLGSALSLAILTALGVPTSTTHLKMTSLASATRFLGGRTDKASFILLCCAWIATFPVSFALSFLLSKGILAILL